MAEPAAFQAVAADGHLAPPPSGISTAVDEDEPAGRIRADAQPAADAVELEQAREHRVRHAAPASIRRPQTPARREAVASAGDERRNLGVPGARSTVDDPARRRADAAEVGQVRGTGIDGRNLDLVIAEVGLRIAAAREMVVIGVAEPRPDAVVGARTVAGVDQPEDIVEAIVRCVRHDRSNHRQGSCAVMAF